MGGRPMEIGNRRRDKKRGGALFMQAGRLVFLFTGVFGLLLLLYSSRSYALEIYTIQRWPVGVTAFAVCLFLWYLDSFHRKMLPFGCVLLVLVCALPCLIWQDELAEQMHALFGYGEAGQAADATGAAMFLAASLAVLLFLLAFVFGMYKLLYLLITVLLLIGPALGSYPGYGTVFLLSVFQLSFWGMRGRLFAGSWKREGNRKGESEKAGAAAGKAIALCAGAFVLPFLLGTAVVRLSGEGEAAEALQQTESETAGLWQEQSEEEKAEGWSVRKEDLFEICRALLPQMILLAAILGCLPYGRRMWRLYRRNTSSGCREIFADLLDMLHACGMPEEYEGLETDFAARLSQMVPSITEAQAGEIVRIVSEEAYGGKEASRQELAFVRNRYYCAAQSLCRKQGWRRRLVFCYRYGYI